MSAQDGPELERKLSWTELDSTGSIPWGSDGAYVFLLRILGHSICSDVSLNRRVQFHRARTHVLIILKHWKPSCSSATKAMACTSTSLRAESKSGWLSAPSSSLEAIKAARPRSWY